MPKYFQFRVQIKGIRPLIWRRFLLATTSTFEDLHDSIQAAGPWEGRHLYLFRGNEPEEFLAAPPGVAEDVASPEAAKRALRPYFGEAPGGRCYYVYDFGDDWTHEVRLEGIVSSPERFRRRLIDGARAFPKEGMGGVAGYAEIAASIRKRNQLRGWDPEFFDIHIARDIFDRPRRAGGTLGVGEA